MNDEYSLADIKCILYKNLLIDTSNGSLLKKTFAKEFTNSIINSLKQNISINLSQISIFKKLNNNRNTDKEIVHNFINNETDNINYDTAPLIRSPLGLYN